MLSVSWKFTEGAEDLAQLVECFTFREPRRFRPQHQLYQVQWHTPVIPAREKGSAAVVYLASLRSA